MQQQLRKGIPDASSSSGAINALLGLPPLESEYSASFSIFCGEIQHADMFTQGTIQTTLMNYHTEIDPGTSKVVQFRISDSSGSSCINVSNVFAHLLSQRTVPHHYILDSLVSSMEWSVINTYDYYSSSLGLRWLLLILGQEGMYECVKPIDYSNNVIYCSVLLDRVHPENPNWRYVVSPKDPFQQTSDDSFFFVRAFDVSSQTFILNQPWDTMYQNFSVVSVDCAVLVSETELGTVQLFYKTSQDVQSFSCKGETFDFVNKGDGTVLLIPKPVPFIISNDGYDTIVRVPWENLSWDNISYFVLFLVHRYLGIPFIKEKLLDEYLKNICLQVAECISKSVTDSDTQELVIYDMVKRNGPQILNLSGETIPHPLNTLSSLDVTFLIDLHLFIRTGSVKDKLSITIKRLPLKLQTTTSNN